MTSTKPDPRCSSCSSERVDELPGHLVVGIEQTPALVGRVEVFVNGERVTKRCRSAMASLSGTDGWAVVQHVSGGAPLICGACKQSVAVEVLRGRVEIQVQGVL